MARTLKKEKPIGDVFFDELITAVKTPASIAIVEDDIWAEKPVDIQDFCVNWLGEGLFPEQEKFSRAMVGNKPYELNTQYDEGHALWGKGSGKDRTISKIQLYLVYKMMCLKNPHWFLREKYGCSIGDDDALDIVNMSINARQAQNVYFKKFKSLLKMCKNPRTGRNWFGEKGVDLREGYDIQNTEVRFPHSITAHSLNSETNTGEGLNILLATIDEFGSFPFEKAFEMLDAIRDTVISRFPQVGKVCVISYKYYNNDPMDTVYRKEKDNPRVYSSKKATFEVNLNITKEKLASQYSRNPEKAKMTYECEGGETEGGYVTKKYMLSYMFSPQYLNPFKGDVTSIDASLLNSLSMKQEFLQAGMDGSGRMYAIHVDLATGRKDLKNDCAGLAMSHVEPMFPKIDEKMKKDLYSEGIVVDFLSQDSELAVSRKGVVTDLAIQLTSKAGTEIQFSDVRKFILKLKTLGFNIAKVTFDGWESRDSIQILNEQGIITEKFSVDKNNEAYDTWKELMYQQLFKTYPNMIAQREAKELTIGDNGKIDHPVESWDRYMMENVEYGSKDVIDAIVASGKIAYDTFSLGSGVFFG